MPAATTSIFVHLHYKNVENPPGEDPYRNLREFIVFCIPHRRFKRIYNPDASTGFWQSGKESPARKEKVRIRVGFEALEDLCRWRLQRLRYADGDGDYTAPVWRDRATDGTPVDEPFSFIGRR